MNFNQKVQQDNFKLYRIWMKGQEIYQRYASYNQLSITNLFILYMVYISEELYTQQELSEILFLPRQTINSSIKQLVLKDYVSLKHLDGSKNSKLIHLTTKGKELGDKVIKFLVEAECGAMSMMRDEERDKLIELTEKQNHLLEQYISELLKG